MRPRPSRWLGPPPRLPGYTEAAPGADGAPRFGAFLGVYTPTLLTILGVILYLRIGWVTGVLGLPRVLLVVALANGITLITTFAFSSVATNGRVGVGGAYYIVSRSLGIEIGGAIGLPLFLSQAISVTLYAFGLAESVRIVWPDVPVEPAAFVIVLAVALLAFRGASLALKVQVPLLFLIGVSLLALTVGALRGPRIVADAPLPVDAPPFWAVFAVFFPAVTGIMAGLGLSGDLRDPARSIPRGALGATLTGFAVYLVVPGILLLGADAASLRSDSLVWTRVAWLGALTILPGLWGAIFSSAVGSILGAPRTLQALANDHLAPAVLGRGIGRIQEPVFGLLVSTAIALLAVFLGDLNTVATVVTMFFLTIYGTLNLVAALETLAGDPSWRPRIRLPWPLSLAGAVACVSVMFLIHPTAAAFSIAAEAVLYILVTRLERRAEWGDARRGAYEALIRWSLLRLARRPMTARSWRPHLLVFADDAERRLDLIRFGTWFGQGRGVVTTCELIVGDILDESLRPEERRAHLGRVLRREGLVAFSEVDVVGDVVTGITDVAQANGIAGLESNTILLGWPRRRELLVDFLRVARRLDRIRKSVVIGRIDSEWMPHEWLSPEIHVWWGGLLRNGDLMLLLAHLLTRNPEWRHGRVRLMSIASDEHLKQTRERDLEHLIEETRLSAEPTVLLRPRDMPVRDVIRSESAFADVVFLGLKDSVPGEEEAYADHLSGLAEGLPTVFFVKNSSLFVGELI